MKLEVKLSVYEIRSYFDDGNTPEELDNALDAAQGAIHSGYEKEVIIEIKVTD